MKASSPNPSGSPSKRPLLRRLARYTCIIVACNILFLFAPKNDCADLTTTPCPLSLIRINSAMSFYMTWDGYAFIDYAMEPGIIMTQGNNRQSRPLFVALGTISGYSLWYLSRPLQPYLADKMKATPSGQFSGAHNERSLKVAIFLVGFILLNFLVLMATLWLFETNLYLLTGTWRKPRWLMNLLLVMLTACNLTKIFFWTAHPQMFALFTPLLCIYIAVKIRQRPTDLRQLLLISLGCGLLLLTYGNALLTLPCIMIALISAGEPAGRGKLIARALAALVVFLLPTIGWMLIIKAIGISFTSEEISRYRQFVWVFDEPTFPALASRFAANTASYLRTFGNTVIMAGLLVLTMITRKPAVIHSQYRLQGNIILWTGLLVFLFYYALGYYSDRLSYTLAPVLLTATAFYLNVDTSGKRGYLIPAIYIIVSLVYMYLVGAPHFSLDYYQ